jgi:hypothetical protein
MLFIKIKIKTKNKIVVPIEIWIDQPAQPLIIQLATSCLWVHAALFKVMINYIGPQIAA